MNGKMKRLLASLMLVAVAASSLSGCALPAEADGNSRVRVIAKRLKAP